MKRHDPEQLNNPAVSEDQETYSLEDIIREFGTAAAEQSPEPVVPVEEAPIKIFEPREKHAPEDTLVFKPIQGEQIAPAYEAPTAEHRRKENKQAPEDTMVFKPIQGEQVTPAFQAPAKIVPEIDPIPPISEPPKKAKRKEPKKERKSIKAVPELPSAQDKLKTCRKGLSSRHIRLLFLTLPVLLGLFLILYFYNEWSFLPLVAELGFMLPLSLLLLSMILAYDVFTTAAKDILRLRLGLHTLTCIVSVLAIILAVTQKNDVPQTYCPIASLLLLSQLKALHSSKVGTYHTLRTVCGFEAPMGIFDTKKLVKNTDSLQRDIGDVPDFLYRLEHRNAPRRIIRAYSTVLFFLLPILAYLISVANRISFVHTWLLLSFGAIPYGMSLSFVRPFASIAKRLSGYHGALCGWHGARIFGLKHTIVLTDEDLFPKKNIVSNGMKIYGAHKAPRIISYALSALKLVESPLTDLFQSLLDAQYGKQCPISEHRIYDDGGIGAQIGGDIVLVGSLSFMRSMGVHMPAGTRVRQAVYVSVDGELAGIFALKYKPSSSTRAGLRDVLANHNFSIILATKDFLICPELIAAKYELPTDSMQIPPYSERIRIAVDSPKERSRQGAMIANDTFGAFAVTVASGRTLRLSTIASLCINLLVGLFGLFLCILLLAWNAIDTASPLHIAAFQLLWAFLSSFVSFMILKF